MNKLEEAISHLNNIQCNLDAIIKAIADSPRQPTEDELLNMLIGAKDLHQVWYDNTWIEYENFKREHRAFDKDDIFDQNCLREYNDKKKLKTKKQKK